MKRKWLAALILCGLTIVRPVTAQAKSYTINNVDFKVQITNTGKVEINETRNYKFSGSFSKAYIEINTAGKCVKSAVCPSYIISNFTVTDENGMELQSEVSGQPGTLQTFTWHYNAADEIKIFKLHYELENAIIHHQETEEFYWQLIGNGWDRSNGTVRATIDLPPGLNGDLIKAYGHGPLNGKIHIPSADRVEFWTENLPPKTFFEIRILFPKPTTKLWTTSRISGQTLTEIIAEEKNGAQKPNKKPKPNIRY